MRKSLHKKGFSLTEVLLAIGTLAIGMSFVGGTFLVGVHLSSVATERTIAAVVADEAFTKIQLYDVGFAASMMPSTKKQYIYTDIYSISTEELSYPSTKTSYEKQYYWSALCRPVYSVSAANIMQVTVFVSRKVGSSLGIPGPVEVPVSVVAGTGNENKLTITDPGQESYINAGSKIIANQTGKIYRVVERDAASENIIVLDIPWQETETDSVWAVPPLVGGKSPCIAVYQKELRFELINQVSGMR